MMIRIESEYDRDEERTMFKISDGRVADAFFISDTLMEEHSPRWILRRIRTRIDDALIVLQEERK